MMFLAYAVPTFRLPAGIIGTSPWLDLTHSFPSARICRGLDYLPFPCGVQPKPSKAWPLPEQRYHFYSDKYSSASARIRSIRKIVEIGFSGFCKLENYHHVLRCSLSLGIMNIFVMRFVLTCTWW